MRNAPLEQGLLKLRRTEPFGVFCVTEDGGETCSLDSDCKEEDEEIESEEVDSTLVEASSLDSKCAP